MVEVGPAAALGHLLRLPPAEVRQWRVPAARDAVNGIAGRISVPDEEQAAE
jgi:hypothetical protein